MVATTCISVFIKLTQLLSDVLVYLSLSKPVNYTPKISKSKRQAVDENCQRYSSTLDIVCDWMYRMALKVHTNHKVAVLDLPYNARVHVCLDFT